MIEKKQAQSYATSMINKYQSKTMKATGYAPFLVWMAPRKVFLCLVSGNKKKVKSYTHYDDILKAGI